MLQFSVHADMCFDHIKTFSVVVETLRACLTLILSVLDGGVP